MRGYRVLLFGSDSISCATLDRLRAAPPSLVRALEVVTPPDRPRGRDRELGSVLLKLEAQRYGLAVHHPWQGAAFRLEANDLPISFDSFDIGVVVSFGHFLASSIVDRFRVAAVNMHPSLLPRFRGAAPIQHAILAGEERTGVSVIELSTKTIDAGRILLQREMPMAPDATFASLSQQLAQMGAEAVMETLARLPELQRTAREQGPAPHGSVAPKIKPELSRVVWEEETAVEVDRKLRALVGFRVPPIFTFLRHPRLQEKRVSILDGRFCAAPPRLDELPAPGNFVYDRKAKTLLVRCAGPQSKGMFECRQLQVEGRRSAAASDFANGHLQLEMRRDHSQFVGNPEVRFASSPSAPSTAPTLL